MSPAVTTNSPGPKSFTLTKGFVNAICALLRGRKVEQRCLIRTELLYRLCRVFNPGADYKVNMVVKFYHNGDSGHAWLTRNGRMFLSPASSISLHKLTLMGESDKYRYYIKEENVHRWFDPGRKKALFADRKQPDRKQCPYQRYNAL